MRTLKELMNLGGRVALITGGAGHIGAAAAESLAELGAQVALVDLDTERVRAAAARIGGAHDVRVEGFAADLEQEAALRGAADQVRGAFGRLDILVNCAAFVGTSGLGGWSVPFAQQTTATWRRAMEVNLTAAFVLAQACAPALAASGHGTIINVSSIYGAVGPDMRLYEGTAMGNPAAYAASKGGLLQLTRWLATVLAPKVRVNAISPGGVRRGQPEEFVRAYESRVPLGRMAVEEDFKGAFAYLAGDLSAYVTGQNLMVDGGWTAW